MARATRPRTRAATDTLPLTTEPQDNGAEPLAVEQTEHAIEALKHAGDSIVRSRLPASAVYMGNNVNTAVRFAMILFESGNAGRDVNVGTVFLKMMRGLELGIGPIEAQAELHAIEGKIGCSGRLLLKKIREAGVRHEWVESDDTIARVRITTPEGETFEDSFSIGEAETAGLLAKKGSNYLRYPKRMLRWRALSFVVNNNIPDLVGGGMLLAEELGAEIDPTTGAILALPEQPPRPTRQPATPAPPPNGAERALAAEESQETVKRVEQNDGAAPGVIGALRKYAMDAGLWDAQRAVIILSPDLAGHEGVELPGAGPYTPQQLAEQPNAGEIRELLHTLAKRTANAAKDVSRPPRTNLP